MNVIFFSLQFCLMVRKQSLKRSNWKQMHLLLAPSVLLLLFVANCDCRTAKNLLDTLHLVESMVA